MPFLTTIGLLAGAGGAAKGFLGGSKMASDARKGLQNFQYQDLSVGAFDEMKASLDLENKALEKLTEQRFGLSDVAQGLSGSEAMAILGVGEEQIGEKEQNLFGQMRKEDARIQQLQAQDFVTRRNMQEQRDVKELQSLQQQLYAGEQMMADSIKGFGELAVGAGIGKMQAEATLGMNPFSKGNKVKNVNNPPSINPGAYAMAANNPGLMPLFAMQNAQVQGNKKLQIPPGVKSFAGQIPKIIGQGIGGAVNFFAPGRGFSKGIDALFGKGGGKGGGFFNKGGGFMNLIDSIF